MLLIYTHKVTPRLTYICKHFFTRILQIKVSFTTKVEEFIAHDSLKLSYTKKQLGNEIFIKSTNLLFEQGVADIDLTMDKWNGLPSFFSTTEKASVPFDIFAAGFYLLSRYEEYLPHVKDQHNRYPAKESLAFRENFLDIPIIDRWAYQFKAVILEKYPDFVFKKRKFKYISTIDIDIAYAFKHKGMLRTLSGYIKDVFSLRLADLWYRTMVNLGMAQDPFDNYDDLLYFQKQYHLETIFFFTVGRYTTFDKNISFRNATYRSLIKSVADYIPVGLHPSYFTAKDEAMLKMEKKRLESIVNRSIEKSRQHYLRFNIPETYQYLINLEIKEDYTMGYAAHYGFRAGTCTPFYFYDLDYEIQTPLKIYPFAVMDGTLRDYLDLSPKRAYETIIKLAREVQLVEGTFITIFHNETLSNIGRWRRWKKMYIDMFKHFSSMKD
ncbi:MAG: hypothetical protein CR985_02160 [Flavobacteriales bacterium]|nr:MAG: hypothetical protein CR985_02160 [Flavobacteriales bacterium]